MLILQACVVMRLDRKKKKILDFAYPTDELEDERIVEFLQVC